MVDQKTQPNLSDPSAQTKHNQLERQEPQEPQEQVSQADATARPASPATPGRRPLFRV